MHDPTDRIILTTAFVTPVFVHWLEWEIAQWVYIGRFIAGNILFLQVVMATGQCTLISK